MTHAVPINHDSHIIILQCTWENQSIFARVRFSYSGYEIDLGDVVEVLNTHTGSAYSGFTLSDVKCPDIYFIYIKYSVSQTQNYFVGH